jgi:RES domain-containing protein
VRRIRRPRFWRFSCTAKCAIPRRSLVIEVDIPDEVSRQTVDEAQLPTDWSRRITVTRAWGDRWLREASTALLIVRCVLVPETYNVIINPRHADAARIKRLGAMPYSLDSRFRARD